jgi:hypothetical protein
MQDLPAVTLLQQSHAIPKSGEELEVLGKAASKKFVSGQSGTLNEAVVETVKHAGLSPEQVKRVIEFANTNAFLSDFHKEGGAHKYVEFHGGPADPAEVLRDLNDGGGGNVFDRGLADYSHDPPKTASVMERNLGVVREVAHVAGALGLLTKTASVLQPRQLVLTAERHPKTAALREQLKEAAVRIGVPTMNDIAGDMASTASSRYQMPAYAGFDPFGEHQKKMQVGMLAAMTGRQPVVHKHANAMMGQDMGLDPGLEYQQPSLGDETRGMLGATGGEMASPSITDDPNAAPGDQSMAGYDPLPEHMKLMQQHMKLMQARAAGAKMASLDFFPAETALEAAFMVEDKPYEYAEPLQDSLEMREKLASAADHMTSELSMLESAFHDALDDLYHEVKTAALDEGLELGQVLAAWQHVIPDASYVKTAFAHIGPRLAKEKVFQGLDGVGASLEKTAHVGMVNTEHPLISTMAGYCQVLDKLSEVRAARDELIQERNRMDFFLKQAALLPKALRAVQSGANRAGDVLGRGAEVASRALLTDSPETAAVIGRGVGAATRALPTTGILVGGGVGAKEVHDRLKYNRPYQKTKNFVLSYVPGTQASLNRRMRLMQQGGMY